MIIGDINPTLRETRPRRISSRGLGAAAPSRARSAVSDRVGYVMERLLNRQGCCRPHPLLASDVAALLRVALIPSVIKGAASRGVSPGSAWAQSSD